VTAHDLAKWSDAQFQLRIKIENDAKLASLGECSEEHQESFLTQ
jgi:predicted NBD/HSP70 family sugar kinase